MAVLLALDPVRRDCYVVLGSFGLFQVELPWIVRLDRVSEAGFAAEPGSTVQHLLSPGESILDVTVVSDQLLGSVAITLLVNYECLTIPLAKRTRSALVSASQLPGTRAQQSDPGGAFFQHIQSLFRVSDDFISPLHRIELRKVDKRDDLSQQDCLQYLQRRIQQLQHRYVNPQIRAKGEVSARVDVLRRSKERQDTDMSVLMERCQEMSEHGEELAEKVDHLRRRCNFLVAQLEQLLGSVATYSPVLSNAEQSMAKELRSIQDQMCSTSKLLEMAQAKVQLGLARVTGRGGTLGVASAQVDTLLSALSDDGRHIKTAVQQVKDLTAFANS